MFRSLITVGCVTALMCSVTAPVEAVRCKPDAVASGTTCMDAYEASVWTVDPPTASSLKQLKKLAKSGAATLPRLLAIPGITQVGATRDDYGRDCPDDGAGCVDFFAVSIPGVTPAAFLTQIQAMALCRNSDKELPDNKTWTAAALGTPDLGTTPGSEDCNTDSAGIEPTGERENCVSDVGAYDLVGNVWEWVADWGPRSVACGSWNFPGGDQQCLAGAGTTREPGVLVRGGSFGDGADAGVFAVSGFRGPSFAIGGIGFRCAR